MSGERAELGRGATVPLECVMLRIPPQPFDTARAARIRDGLAEQGFTRTDPLLDSVFGNSAFLGRLALRETAVLEDYFTIGPQAVLDAAIAQGLAVADADITTNIYLRLIVTFHFNLYAKTVIKYFVVF